ITLEMHQEVNDQDRLLDESNSAFSGLGDSLRNSMGRMNRMVSTRHKRQMCLYIGMILAFFVVMYAGSGLLFRSPGPSPG
ncbi:hypothetical protein BDF14DRAFT_1704574, partial [Spinellus fusiger]